MEFSALSQAQKTELMEHRVTNKPSNSKKSGSNRGVGGPSKKKRGAGGGNKAGGNGGGLVVSKLKNKARQKAAA